MRLVCLYKCTESKTNEIPIHEGNGKLFAWHCLCVPFDVNGGHIVLGHDGCLLISAPQGNKHTNLKKKRKKIESSEHIFLLFGLDGG